MTDAISKTHDLVFRFPSAPSAKGPHWKCQMTPGYDGLALRHVPEDRIPNAFHRFMQRVCFGFRWEKQETE